LIKLVQVAFASAIASLLGVGVMVSDAFASSQDSRLMRLTKIFRRVELASRKRDKYGAPLVD
jgi:hypothetical protein